jgi:hypothetical protein
MENIVAGFKKLNKYYMPENKNETGKIVRQNLTVANAEQIKDFYSKVTG